MDTAIKEPFIALYTLQSTPREIVRSCILLACQTMKTGIAMRVGRTKVNDKIWLIYVNTDFSTRSVQVTDSPISSGLPIVGTRFAGWGRALEKEPGDSSLFKVRFVFDPDRLGKDLIDVSLNKPEKVLEFIANLGY